MSVGRKSELVIVSVKTRPRSELIETWLELAATTILRAFVSRYANFPQYVMPTHSMCKEMWQIYSEMHGATVMRIPPSWDSEKLFDQLFGLYVVERIKE